MNQTRKRVKSARANQADIARAAGVSTATVSRALNGTGVVTEDARARIDAAIAELGYMPHGAARALASRRSHTVGAVIPTLASAIFAAGVDAFERRLNENGLTLLLALSNYDLETELQKVQTLLERGVDAIMLVGGAHAPGVHEAIARGGVPYIHTWAWEEDTVHPQVGFDNYKTMRKLAEHLGRTGHYDVAMIAGIAQDNDRAAQRIEGARDGFAAVGVELSADRLVEAEYTHEAARQAFRKLWNASVSKPSAIVCGNDVLATGALVEAQSQGIGVPHELSITGFDDLPLAAHLNPPLTTISVPASEMGSRAADALAAALQAGEPPVSTLLDAELVVRGTTR